MHPMTTTCIALLIPCTCNGRDNWKRIEDTYLYNLTIKTLLTTASKEHKYVFYIGYDTNDRIFSLPSEQERINCISEKHPNVTFKFIEMKNVEKGYLTKMWNILFRYAYIDKCEYFYQCGDDITFYTNGWVNDSIGALLKSDGIGMSGPVNNNPNILTQAFVSRKHMDIFGYFFPEELKNWYSDDWYNELYKPNYFLSLTNHYCSNDGGAERYVVGNDPNPDLHDKCHEIRIMTTSLVQRDKVKLSNYVDNYKSNDVTHDTFFF